MVVGRAGTGIDIWASNVGALSLAGWPKRELVLARREVERFDTNEDSIQEL